MKKPSVVKGAQGRLQAARLQRCKAATLSGNAREIGVFSVARQARPSATLAGNGSKRVSVMEALRNAATLKSEATMGEFILGLLVGLFVGSTLGFLTAALMVVAARTDEESENPHPHAFGSLSQRERGDAD